MKMENKPVGVADVLSSIQTELIAPKSQFNDFGKYKYRSCEDILEALKPLLKKYSACVTMSDNIVLIGTRVYVEARATLTVGNASVTVTAFAREAETKKGMDEAQITGAASSYARKYALNGLFSIDDTKDSDTTNTHNAGEPAKVITDAQLNILRDMLTASNGDEGKFCAWLKVESLDKLPAGCHQKAFAALKAKVRK